MIKGKKTIADAVVGCGESWLSKLANAQLKELFTLRNEALGD